MAFDVAGARAAGYSDAEIADFLAQGVSFDAAAARQSGYSDAELIDYLSAGQKKSTVLGELKRGVKQYISSTQTGIGGITSPEEAARAGAERAQKIGEEAGEGVSFEPVKEAYKREGILSALGEAASQVPRAVAGMLPAAGAAIAGGKAGAIAGTLAAPALGPAAPAGPIIGGLLGAGAALYPSMAGSNIERQAQEQAAKGEQLKIDRPAAYGAAVGQTALEAAGTGAILGKRLIKGVLGIVDDAQLVSAAAKQALVKEAERSLLGATGVRAAQGALEIPTEVAQAVLERAQAGLDVTSPEAWAEYGDTAYQALLGGAGLGALTGAPSRSQARAEMARIEPPAPSTAQAEAQRRYLAARQKEVDDAAAAEAARVEAEQKAQAKEDAEIRKPKGYEQKQGLLFKREEMEAPTPEAAPVAQPEPTAPPEAEPAPTQLSLGLEQARTLTDYEQEIERLKADPQRTPEFKARIAELQGLVAPMRESMTPKGYTGTGQGRLFAPAEMEASGLRKEKVAPAEAEPKPMTTKQMERAGQKTLPFEDKGTPAPTEAIQGTTGIVRPEEEIKAPTTPVPEPKLAPKVPAEFQPVMEKLTTAGVRPETTAWAEKAGNRPFLRKIMVMAPETAPEARKALKLKEGSPKAEVFDALFPTPGVPAFKPAPGAGESRLGLSGQLGITPAEAPAPRARKPVGRAVVSARGAAPAPAAPTVAAKPALAKVPSSVRAEQFWKDTAKAVGGKAKPFSELTPVQRAAWREAVKEEDVSNLRSEYERIVEEGKPERLGGEELFSAPDRDELIRRAQSLAQRQQGSLKRIAESIREDKPLKLGLLSEARNAEYVRKELQDVKEKLAETKRTRDTAEDFVARVAQEAADGNVDSSLVDFTNWLYANKRPLLDGLRLQIRTVEDTAAAGSYNGLARLLRLHKGTGAVESPDILAHELVHSAEQMMDDAQQLSLINEWQKVMLAKRRQDARQGTPNTAYWEAVMNNLVKPTKENYEALSKTLPSKSYYQYTSPSEYWAENAGRILQQAADGSPLFKFKLFLQQLLAGIKAFLGKEANPSVIKLARDVLLNPSSRIATRSLDYRYRVSIVKKTKDTELFSAPSPTEGIAASSELMKDQPGVIRKAFREMARFVGEKDDVSFVTRFRTEVADSAASIDIRANILFDNKVRNELLNITNPMLKVRQAQAPEALTAGYYRVGRIVLDKVAGQWVVPEKGGPGGSMEDIYRKIKEWGDAKGFDIETAVAEASKMIEARRLSEMIKANQAAGETVFPIHKLSAKDSRSEVEQVEIAMRGLTANPEIQDVVDMMDKQRAELIDHMVEVGRISKDLAQEYKDAAGYVPFDRVEDFYSNYQPKRGTGRGIAQLKSLPKFVGSTTREVGNTISNHAKLMGWMIKQTIKQDATSDMLNLLADIGQARRLGPAKDRAENAGNVIETFKDGNPVYFEVRSHWDAVAFRDSPEVKMTIIKVFQSVSNILRKIVTAMPPFVAKQVSDDIQRALITSGVKEPYKLILPAITNFIRIGGHELVFGKSHPITLEASRKGFVGDVDYNAADPSETILFNMGYSKRGWISALHHRLESTTRASDLAIRKAIYDRTLEETKSTNMTEGDTGLAMARAREFINFRRRGASKTVGAAIATVPFFNAYLQSSDLLLRSAIGTGTANVERAVAKRMFWLQASKMVGFSLIYAMVSSGEDEYEKLTDEQRANNWVIDGKKIPVPGDMAALFKVPVESVVRYMDRLGTPEEQQTSEAVKQTLGYVYEQLIGRVSFVPQAVRPLAEALTNYSFMTARPLVGTYQKGLPGEFQTTGATSELAKAIAKFAANNIQDPFTDTPLELSPIIIDNTLRGYLGGAVPLMNMLIDQMVNPNKTDRPLSQYWFLGQYLTPEVPMGPKDEFYDLVNRVMPVKRALDNLAKTDQPAAMRYYEKNKDKLQMAELVNTALTKLRDTRDYIKYLESPEGAKKISDSAERLKRKQEVQKYENELVSWVRKAKTQIFVNQKG